MSDLVLSFAQISKKDLPLVGGKGANLGEMWNAQFQVPNGFCVTTHAYQAFFQEHADWVMRQLRDLGSNDIQQVSRVATEIRTYLSGFDLPAPIVEQVRSCWKEADPHQEYAVRSSATAEDLPTASFAGQQDTYLNVVGADALLSKVKDCFISLYTDRALLYRLQNQVPHQAVAMSVVVQQMVFPQVAGIAFTADPISQRRDILSVDASYGLGEALVSGLVNADLFKIHKESGKFLSKKIQEKNKMIQPLPGGGTEEVAIDKAKATLPSLSDAQLLSLLEVAKRIEAHYGIPQDIEWAFQEGKLFILQARPITSLFEMPPQQAGEARIFACISQMQMMTDPMSTLGTSVWRNLLPPHWTDQDGEFAYFHNIGCRIYADMSPIIRHPLLSRIVYKVLGIADEPLQASFLAAKKRPELYAGGKTFALGRSLPWVFRLGKRIWQVYRSEKPEIAATWANEKSAAYIAKTRQNIQAAADPLTKLNTSVQAFQNFFYEALAWIPYLSVGMISQKNIRKYSTPELLPLIEDMERGLEGNVVTEMNLTLGDIADLAQQNPQAMTWLSKVAQGLSEPIPSSEVDAPFFQAWQDFIAHYGVRCGSEIDIYRKRWTEDPAPLATLMLNMAQTKTLADHRAHYNHLKEARKEANQAFIARMPERKRMKLQRLIDMARFYVPLREHHKLLMITLMYEIKKVCLEIGQRFQQQGQIMEVDDIFYLTLPQIRKMLSDPSITGEHIPQEKARFERYKLLMPPRLLASTGESVQGAILRKNIPKGALAGTAASAGVYEGRAHVILDYTVETLEPGEILVTVFTDPGWTPLFVNAKALVTEVGGLMTHGALVAREYGMPAVVSVDNATQAIRTGMRIRVNGNLGYVEILEDAPAE